MPLSNTWRPDHRSRRTINGVTITYLAGDTEGAYLIETVDGRTVVVYPTRTMTTAMRRKTIVGQLDDPDPLASAVGALILAGVDPADIEQPGSEPD